MEHIKLRTKKDDISIDELLEIAESSDETVDTREMTEAERFAQAMGIKPGEKQVPAYIIYDMYHQWKGKYRKKQPLNVFFRDFMKLFKSRLTGTHRAYYVNEEPFDLTVEGIWAVRNSLRRKKAARERAKRKKKENKKIKS